MPLELAKQLVQGIVRAVAQRAVNATEETPQVTLSMIRFLSAAVGSHSTSLSVAER